MHDTYKMAIIPPNEVALMIAAFLLGFADATVHTNIIAVTGNQHNYVKKIYYKII